MAEATAERRAVRVRISGRVQGVAFRAATRAEAQRRGVAGWVRNLPDGQVEAHFEGTPEAVAALVTWCHRGPPGARVDGVTPAPAAVANEAGFRIR